jgi:hypothetical protein
MNRVYEGSKLKFRDVLWMKPCICEKVEETLQDIPAVITMETGPYEIGSQLSDVFFKMFPGFEAYIWFRHSKYLKPACDFLMAQ